MRTGPMVVAAYRGRYRCRGGARPRGWCLARSSRGVRCEYRGADGGARTLSGRLLETYPSGLVVGTGGGRMLLSWDALVILELAEG